jgi:hypothetical protein
MSTCSLLHATNHGGGGVKLQKQAIVRAATSPARCPTLAIATRNFHSHQLLQQTPLNAEGSVGFFLKNAPAVRQHRPSLCSRLAFIDLNSAPGAVCWHAPWPRSNSLCCRIRVLLTITNTFWIYIFAWSGSRSAFFLLFSCSLVLRWSVGIGEDAELRLPRGCPWPASRSLSGDSSFDYHPP